MKICVIGLGYMGLPFSALLATSGYEVVGFDINKKRISDLQRKKCPFSEIGLPELLEDMWESKNFTPSNKIVASDVYIISVPTPLKNRAADLSYVEAAMESVCTVAKKGDLIILESTVTPGTCRKVIVGMLEDHGIEGCHVVHCPERALPGNTLNELIHNDRIIGGVDRESALMAKKIYSSFVKGRMHITDDITAETVKLMENTYRDVNIALANEFLRISRDIKVNVWEAIELANKHPRVNILKPGPGVGGHCIAIDPWFLTENSNSAMLIPAARTINDFMPLTVALMVKNTLKGIAKPKVAILGAAYKANVDDARESPTHTLIKLLKEEKIDFVVTDPLVKKFDVPIVPIKKALKDADCAIIMTDHAVYTCFTDEDFRMMRNKTVIDTRKTVNKEQLKTTKYILLGDNKLEQQ